MSQTDFYLTHAHPARRNTMYVAIAAGAVAGALVEWLGGKFAPAFAACVIVTGAIEFARAVSYAEPGWGAQREILASPIRRRLMFSSLSAAVLLAISRLRVPESIAYASERKLLAVSANPTDPKNIDEARDVLARAKAANLQINPTALERSGRKFVNASNQNPETWDAALDFLGYKSYINSKSGLLPNISAPKSPNHTHYWVPQLPVGLQPPQFHHFGSEPISKAAQLNKIGQDFNLGSPDGDAYLVGQDGNLILDGEQARNVILINVHIIYNGGPVELTNLYLINCTFEMEAATNTENLALAVLSPSPATTFAGE